jgi:hypothetical protein
MKQPRLTRRNFLKLGAGSAGALALASVVGPAKATAQAQANAPAVAPTTPIAGGTFYVAPTFSGIASALSFGAPTDIVMGWDGVLMGIDPSGAPHLYDSISDAWQPHGEGIDAAAQVGDLLYFFKGDSFVTASQQALLQFGQVQSISSQWPALPFSFTQYIIGAGNFDGRLLLFTSGRYASVDGTIPPASLVTLANWPFIGAWKDGVIDGAYCTDVNTGVILMRGNEFIRIDPVAQAVTSQPALLSTLNPFNPHLPPDWLATGFDTGTVVGAYQIAFRGNAMVIYAPDTPAPSSPQYIPAFFSKGWPTTWHPMLIQAPSGHVGDLWAVDSANNILQHDGTNWNIRPGKVTGVSVGQDGTVYHISEIPKDIWRWDGTTWVHAASSTFSMTQISVGDADHVWVRDTNNQVYRYSNGAFTPVSLGSTPIHMTANSDGTLWHCDGVAPHAYRHISEGTAASSQVAVGNSISSVQKVASTGFGLAFCLATGATVTKTGVQVAADTPQAYQYDSPFVFKTSVSYGIPFSLENDIADIAIGSSCIFVADQNSQPSAVVALDSQTGAERWRQALPDFGHPHGLIYDPALQLVYFVAHNFGQNPISAMIAVDALTGERRWTYQLGGFDVGFWLPTLSGRYLCAGDTSGTVHLLDTVAALKNGQQNLAPTPVWNPLPQIPNMRSSPETPFTRAGAPTFATNTAPGAPQAIYITYQAAQNFGSPAGLTVTTALNIANGTTLWSQTKEGLVPDVEFFPVLDSVVGLCLFSNSPNNTPEPALIVNGNMAIWALRLADNGATSRVLNVPQRDNVTAYFSSGLTLSGNTLYVGDSHGTLYVIGTVQLTFIKQTEDQLDAPYAMMSRPVVITDSQANTAVVFVRAGLDMNIFDPVNGTIETLGLEQNALDCAIYDANHGVLYGSSSIAGNSLGQVFGLRIAKFIQDERAFIIESQMMQDYDEPADGTSNPPTAARYQTHVSLVDSSNAALQNVSVKIWADEAVMLSIDGGDPVLVDPNASDPNQQFVAFQTDGTGSFTIHSGSYNTDGSDAPDFTAVPLRLWAGFMDVHERMVVVPDAEFHTRLSTTHATTQDPSVDHPNQINLQNVSDYPTYSNGVEQPGAPLFTADEQTNGTTQGAANSISNTMGAIGGGASIRQRLAAKRRALGLKDMPNRYGVDGYTLPGMTYQAANTPADRSVTPPPSTAQSFTFINSSYTSMFHTDATAAIDALGIADAAAARSGFSPDGMRAPQFNLVKHLKDAWKDIKKAGTTVTHAIISAAKDLYIGIRYVVNGIVNVVKAVVQDVEDAMAAIGSFFVQLGKDIVKVIRAIGSFFDFKHVIASYNVIRRVLDDYLGSLASDLKSVQAGVDSSFQTTKTNIKTGFGSLIGKVEGTTPINQQPSAGSTPHSVMSVQPVPPLSVRAGVRAIGRTGAGIRADGSSGGSQAVQGMWGTHKLKQNHARSTSTDGTTTTALTNFASGFADRLKGDLSSDFSDVKQQFESTFKATSASQFFADALGDVLSIFEGVALLSVDVVQAFTDGLFGVADDLVGALQNAGTIRIPVLSTLWKMVTGKPLEINLVDIFAFIIAIPTTYIYRILSGTWMTSSTSAVSATTDPQAVGATTMQNFLGVVGSIAYVIGGWVSGFLDAVVVTTDSQIPLPVMILAKISGAGLLLIGAVQKALGFLNFGNKTGAQKAGVEFLLALTTAKTVTTLLIGPLVAKSTTPSAGVLLTTFINCLLSLLQMSYVFTAQLNQPIELLLVTLFQQIPSITGWFKLAAPLLGYIAPASDFLFMAAAGGLSLATTLAYWHKTLPTDSAPPPTHRLYFPWISFSGTLPSQPFQAQLLPGS